MRRLGAGFLICLLATSCSYALPWTADWNKPGTSFDARRAAIERCHESTMAGAPRHAQASAADDASHDDAPSHAPDWSYTRRFQGCMHRLGWSRS